MTDQTIAIAPRADLDELTARAFLSLAAGRAALVGRA